MLQVTLVPQWIQRSTDFTRKGCRWGAGGSVSMHSSLPLWGVSNNKKF